MSSSRRSARTTAEQYEIMVQYMQEHENLLRGTFSPAYTAQQRERDWGQLVERLNSAGGAVKTVERWRKAWQDWKSNVKAKAARIRSSRSRTGGGPPPKEQFTPAEEVLVGLLGEVSIVGVDTTAELGVSLEEQTQATGSAAELRRVVIHDGATAGGAGNVSPPTSQETEILSPSVTAADSGQQDNPPSSPHMPQEGQSEVREPRHRRRSRIRALRQQYQNEVGQSFIGLQREQQAQLRQICGSLTALVGAVNRVADAAEELREIKDLLTVTIYFIAFMKTFRSSMEVQHARTIRLAN
ncbi:myb-related transcription factor, partner of profilin-like [Ornithodoros turicata]|uniref:myb-related transcription factor, partner of profilin-like n=1 Tax=Ornithodoros turicata TaxID=34597 RepID=UPI00313A2C86